MSKYTTHFIPQLNKSIFGFYNPELMSKIDNLPYIFYSIRYEHVYRPDLISFKFYGRSDLEWLISFFNRFSNSPEDYFFNRTILIPDITEIEGLL